MRCFATAWIGFVVLCVLCCACVCVVRVLCAMMCVMMSDTNLHSVKCWHCTYDTPPAALPSSSM